MDTLVQSGDILINQRLAIQHNFEAIVFWRIVTSGYHHTTLGRAVVCGVIEDRCWYCADIDDISTTRSKTFDQGFRKCWTVLSAVIANDQCLLPACFRFRSDGHTDRASDVLTQIFTNNPANVISPEDMRDVCRVFTGRTFICCRNSFIEIIHFEFFDFLKVAVIGHFDFYNFFSLLLGRGLDTLGLPFRGRFTVFGFGWSTLQELFELGILVGKTR